ncbi:UNVERIFIED_CONTAM: hypothetical protein K2H54_029044 [Gekko kuhli]
MLVARYRDNKTAQDCLIKASLIPPPLSNTFFLFVPSSLASVLGPQHRLPAAKPESLFPLSYVTVTQHQNSKHNLEKLLSFCTRLYIAFSRYLLFCTYYPFHLSNLSENNSIGNLYHQV